MKNEKLFESVINGNYDSKHYNNLFCNVVPETLVKQIEDGCSLETLELIAADFPICKYKTQITIHGLFNAEMTSRIGYYKNVVKNQNGSLGIRWSAIDNEKKNTLAQYVPYGGWRLIRDSNGSKLVKTIIADYDFTAKAKYTEACEDAKKIDTSLFTGDVCVYVTYAFGVYYVDTVINFCCFPVANMSKIVRNLTDMEIAEIDIKIKEKKDEQMRKDNEEKEKANAHKKAFQEYKDTHPFPENFERVDDYTANIGDVIAKYHDNLDGSFGIVYYVVRKERRTYFLMQCNESGETEINARKRKLGLEPYIGSAVVKKAAQEQKKTHQEQKKTTEINDGLGVQVIDYSQKAVAVIGEGTIKLSATLKKLGGRYNSHLSCGKGWIFPATKKDEVMKVVGG